MNMRRSRISLPWWLLRCWLSLQAKVQKGEILSNDDEGNKFNAELYLSELDLDSNVRTDLITSKSNRDMEDILNMAKELIEMHKK